MQPCPAKSPVKVIDSVKGSNLINYGIDMCKPNEIDKLQTKQNYLDFYVIGKIWLEALSTSLVGEKVNVIPTVKAAAPGDSLKEPQLMRYKDLPIYKSKHYESKEEAELKKNCPDRNVKLLHQYLLPYVKDGRAKVTHTLCDVNRCFVNCYEKAKNEAYKTKENFIRSMRDPENLQLRYGVVALGSITGYLIGRKLSGRTLFTTVGLVSAGALCFPKETDCTFRNVVCCVGNLIILIYTKSTGNTLKFREKLTCKDEMPQPPPDRPVEKCIKNK